MENPFRLSHLVYTNCSHVVEQSTQFSPKIVTNHGKSLRLVAPKKKGGYLQAGGEIRLRLNWQTYTRERRILYDYTSDQISDKLYVCLHICSTCRRWSMMMMCEQRGGRRRGERHGVKTQNLEVPWQAFQWCLHCIAHVNISRLQSKHPEQYLLSVHLKFSSLLSAMLTEQTKHAQQEDGGGRLRPFNQASRRQVRWSEMTIERVRVEFNEVQLSSWHECIGDCTNLVVRSSHTACFIIDNFSQFDTQLLFCCRFVCAFGRNETHTIGAVHWVSSGENVRKTSRKWEWELVRVREREWEGAWEGLNLITQVSNILFQPFFLLSPVVLLVLFCLSFSLFSVQQHAPWGRWTISFMLLLIREINYILKRKPREKAWGWRGKRREFWLCKEWT